jgi:hypothetical protein
VNVTLDLDASPCELRLEDAEEFRAFKLVVLGDGSSAEVANGLRPIGRLLDDDTAMLDIVAVRRLPGARDDADWREAYEAMITFAARHGWVDAEHGLVQAHCERGRQ